MDLDFDFKDTCYDCGAHNFNIWGTVISGHLNLEIRCMRCGEILKETNREFEALLLQDIGIFLSDD